MNKYIYTAALLGVMTLASCQKEEAGIDFNSDPEAVKISATVGNSIFSRSNPLGDAAAQKVFNSGDKIGVSADAQVAVTYTFDGTKWTPAANTYLKWTQDAMDFTAYYPVTTGTDAQNFTLPTTQNTKDLVADADYMTAAPVSKKKSDGDISLELSRQTARIIVKIAGFNNQYTDAQKYVNTVSLLTYATAYTDGTVTTATTPTPITPYCGNETPVTDGYGVGTTFTALVLPDAAHPDAEFIALTSGADSKTLTVKGIPAHEAGKSYTYNVTVGKDQAKITGVTIADWGTSETIADGDMEAEPAFSDANFVNVLKETPYNVPVDAKGNINPKDATTKTALEAITELNINGKDISDLSGIEFLTNLTKLVCNTNKLTSLDITPLSLLSWLDCRNQNIPDGTTLALILTKAQNELPNIKDNLDATITPNIKD